MLPAFKFSRSTLFRGLGLRPLCKGRRNSFDDVGQRRLARHAATVVLLEAVLGKRMLDAQLGRRWRKTDAIFGDASERAGVFWEDLLDDQGGLEVNNYWWILIHNCKNV